MKPRYLEANSKVSFEEVPVFHITHILSFPEKFISVSGSSARKADGQVWDSHQIHQINPEQQSKTRSRMEGNYMAGKWS